MDLKVLIPTDCSSVAALSVEAGSWFRTLGSVNLHLLSVVSTAGDVLTDSEGNLLSSEGVDLSALMKEKENVSKRVEARFKNELGSYEHHVEVGYLTDSIEKIIEREEIDLLIMGSEGAHGIKDLISGSSTGKLIRKSGIPVLSIREKFTGLGKVLIAGDFFSEDFYVPDGILSLLNKVNSEVYLVGVSTPSSFKKTGDLLDRIDAFCSKHSLNPFWKGTYCDIGVEEGILNFADRIGANLIVMQNHGREGFQRLLKGSISENVVNHGSHNVMTYH